jgi:hypothetical protein
MAFSGSVEALRPAGLLVMKEDPLRHEEFRQTAL